MSDRQYCLDKAADCERKAAQARHPDAAKEFQSHCRKVARGSGNARFQPESRRHSADLSSGRISEFITLLGGATAICALYGLKLIGDRSTKVVVAVGTWLMIAVGTCSLGSAQQAQTGGPTRSPEGAAVHFVGLSDGATLPTKATIRFGLRDMGVAPAGFERANSGHHHLLIDTELPHLDQPIPNDFNHLHYGAGQTEAEISLKPGTHTLQLLFGDKDHIPHTPPLMSAQIRVVVADPGTVRTTAPPTRKKRIKKRSR